MKRALRDGERVCGVAYVPEDETRERAAYANVVVDSTGSTRLFSRFRMAGPSVPSEFNQQVAVFAQFRNARRDPERIRELGGPEAAFRHSMESLNPELTWRVEGCDLVEPIRAMANYSHSVEPFVGNGWLCVVGSHQFNDPIFSYGVSFALIEVVDEGGALKLMRNALRKDSAAAAAA